VTPSLVELVVPTGAKRTKTLTLQGGGSAPLVWELSETGGGRQASQTIARAITADARHAGANSSVHDTRALFAGVNSVNGFTPTSAGDVLASFIPAGVQVPWGVGVADNLWLSDAQALRDSEFRLDGTPTGVSWPTPWATGFPADMAYVSDRNLMCQVVVGGDNGIHCFDPTTGAVVDQITGQFPWTVFGQRGLAYKPDDDTFFIGGWDEGVIYHVKGLSHDDKGTVVSSCVPADGSISGLAYNQSMGVLWAATNSPTDTVYELDPATCEVLSVIAHPSPGFNSGGLDLDPAGNLWMVAQNDHTAFLVESGVPNYTDVTWLSPTPTSGTLAPGATQQIQLSIDTTGLQPGLYLASLIVNTNAGRTPQLRIPISLVVSDYQKTIDVGSDADYTDASGEVWASDQAWSAGSFGYVQRSLTYRRDHTIAGTREPRLYQSERIDPYAYRFDNVPNGVYQIDLRFAELRDKGIANRLFDVVIESTTVLPAHDIEYEKGAFAADDHTFYVEVADAQLDIRFIPLEGQPVLNGLRVTRRPDR
jgi:hypothetical protein